MKKILITAIALLGVLCIIVWQKKFDPNNFHPSLYSDAEMKQFWKEYEEPVVMSLINRSYRIPEIQRRYDESMAIVNKRYGSLDIKMVSNYVPESHSVIAGSSISSTGVPELSLIIPATMDVHRELKNSKDPKWLEMFEYVVVLNIMHELDHIGYEEKLGNRSSGLPSLDELVEKERMAWARTCEYSIRPLMEKYSAHLPPNSRYYYHHWVQAGRNADSPKWREFIRSVYKTTRK